MDLAMDLSKLAVLRPILPFPLWQKTVALVVGFVLILIAYLYFGWMPIQDDIDRTQKKTDQQQQLFTRNTRIAKNLPQKKKEFAKLEKQLNVALNMLPKKSQIPDLLIGVTRAGKDAGLEFSTFKPLPEVKKQFYAEVPVNLSVTGTYRQLAGFLDRVGRMPRIVDVQNLSLERAKMGAADLLTVKGQALTYRFIESGTGKEQTRKGKHAGR